MIFFIRSLSFVQIVLRIDNNSSKWVGFPSLQTALMIEGSDRSADGRYPTAKIFRMLSNSCRYSSPLIDWLTSENRLNLGCSKRSLIADRIEGVGELMMIGWQWHNLMLLYDHQNTETRNSLVCFVFLAILAHQWYLLLMLSSKLTRRRDQNLDHFSFFLRFWWSKKPSAACSWLTTLSFGRFLTRCQSIHKAFGQGKDRETVNDSIF